MQKGYKERAIKLRMEGKTYSEILAEVPVAKSTLSLWLRSVGLAESQRQCITEKRTAARLRGAAARRSARVEETESLIRKGVQDVSSLTIRELWLIGVALYWGEGSKQHEHAPSVCVAFGNSDVKMLLAFLAWLDLLEVRREDIYFELYVHESRKEDSEAFRNWWAQELGISLADLTRLYFKRGNPKTNRHNTGDLYHGFLRIKVRNSTVLNRRIHGWFAGIAAALGGGVIGNTSAFGAEDSRFEP